MAWQQCTSVYLDDSLQAAVRGQAYKRETPAGAAHAIRRGTAA